jgi:phosphoribosylaminoimidazolecarboxamide formyltransferase / IMP cyclohydrolase
MTTQIRRALLSVFDKSGLIPFARTLAEAKVELISTGGTAKALRAAGLPVIELSDYTGFPEMLDGRVKTLHPKVHGGLLYLRGNPAHETAAQAHGIGPIDLVAVNLYPFEQTIAKPGVALVEAVENIDIGGPAMLRSAAKNHEHVTVLVDPGDYGMVGDQIKAYGHTAPELRRKLAARVFARTAAYDSAIAAYLIKVSGATGPRPTSGAVQSSLPLDPDAEALPPALVLDVPRAQSLRYGENPHQRAALYGDFPEYFEQLHGKELS